MRKRINLFLSLVLCLLFVGISFAADTADRQSAVNDSHRSSKIVGMSVYDDKGESLAKVDELILTPQGCVNFAVLSHGGAVGIGEKFTPVPFSALKLREDGKQFVIAMDKKALEGAPTIERKDSSSLSSEDAKTKFKFHENRAAVGTDMERPVSKEAKKQ